jgi:catalase
MLPVNAPKCGFKNDHYDGGVNFMHRDEEVDYYPSWHAPLRQAEPHSFPVPTRFADALGHPKVSHELRLRIIWINFLTYTNLDLFGDAYMQCDESCGMKVANRLNGKPSM